MSLRTRISCVFKITEETKNSLKLVPHNTLKNSNEGCPQLDILQEGYFK